jgi:hypothetical protein
LHERLVEGLEGRREGVDYVCVARGFLEVTRGEDGGEGGWGVGRWDRVCDGYRPVEGKEGCDVHIYSYSVYCIFVL